MQSRKQVVNPEVALFNIRKVNKKIMMPMKHLQAFDYEKQDDE